MRGGDAISHSDKTLWFATTNEHKLQEAREILADFGVRVRHIPASKVEIQSSELEEISSFAADTISRTHVGIVVVEDSGLFVRALSGFPGPFSAYVHRSIGAKGILRLLGKNTRRSAYFQASIAASESGRTLRISTGRVRGKISWSERGKNGFGFDPIFIPKGSELTFAEMSENQKNELSHRSKGFKKLAEWFLSL